MSRPEVWAFYRAYYGGDTIRLSLESVLPQVDRVYVYYRNKPFYDITHVGWQGERIKVPDNIDGLIENATMPGVKLLEHQCSSGCGQVPHIVNDLILPTQGRPDYLLYLSTDYLLPDGAVDAVLEEAEQTDYLTLPAVHSWRYLKYRLPARKRWGAVMMNTAKFDKLPAVAQESHLPLGYSNFAHTIDLSLASTPPTMLWKYLLRMVHASMIPDDHPVPGWFTEWLKWLPGQEYPAGKEWGWCQGERQLGQPELIQPRLLPECAQIAAAAQEIPDKWVEMDWHDILGGKCGA